MRKHVAWMTALGVALALHGAAPARADEGKTENKEAKRLEESRQTYVELTQVKESIPRQLQEKCQCVAVFPDVVKGAVGWGGRHGKGVMSCRGANGWSDPIFLTLTGGSFGLQIGVEKTELVLFFMNDKAARSLLESKFTLGGKGSVAAGPYGRSAEADTDLRLNAEIYSYAKSKGAFAGISLEGAHLGPDNEALHRFYGPSATPEGVLFHGKAPVHTAAAATRFTQILPL